MAYERVFRELHRLLLSLDDWLTAASRLGLLSVHLRDMMIDMTKISKKLSRLGFYLAQCVLLLGHLARNP
jgi:hypothetical protein